MFLSDFNYQTFGKELAHGKDFFPVLCVCPACLLKGRSSDYIITVGLFFSFITQLCGQQQSKHVLFIPNQHHGDYLPVYYRAHITGNKGFLINLNCMFFFFWCVGGNWCAWRKPWVCSYLQAWVKDVDSECWHWLRQSFWATVPF